MAVANSKRDYYAVLGVARDAAPEQVKKAYRRLAHRYHPDRNRDDADAESKFKEAAEAFEVLSDPTKRQRYDRYGHAGLSGAGVHDYSSMDVGDVFSMFSDMFDMGFGGRGTRSRGADLQTEVELTLEDVLRGANRTIEYTRSDFCDACGGNGTATGSDPRPCHTCGGYGKVEQAGGLGAIFGRVITTCPQCRGRGTLVGTPCPSCHGRGRQPKGRVVNVEIPPGIHDGQAVRLRGEGEPSEDGSRRGDLHCYARVRPHPFLQRHGNDIVCQMPISFTQAALGAHVEVPTIQGKAELKIPPGTQHGQVFRLAELGLPDIRTRRPGDELVQITVEIPKRLNKEQSRLLREFANTEDKSVLPESKGFFEKLMRYLARDDA